jgi:hypothetical protein
VEIGEMLFTLKTMDKVCIVIQGPSEYIHEQKTAWGTTQLIFSTWKGNEDKYTSDDIVIFNEIPENPGFKNYELQRLSTYNGILLAKELGFEYVLKLRSDLIPSSGDNFLKSLDFNLINFLCWHDSHVHNDFHGYLVDYLMFGQIEKLLKIWDSNYTKYNVPELSITKQYFDLFDVSNLNFFLKSLNDKNELIWKKYGINLSTYNNHGGFRTDKFQLI